MNVDQFKKLNEAYGLTEEQAGQLIEGYRTLQKENERLENELHQMGDYRNTLEGELDKAISEIKFQVERNDKQREVYFRLESELAAMQEVLKTWKNGLKNIVSATTDEDAKHYAELLLSKEEQKWNV